MKHKDMKQEFDFDKIGKQMPYNVPENFFVQLEENVMKEVGQTIEAESGSRQPKAKSFKLTANIIRAAIAAAAGLALFFIVQKSLPNEEPAATDDFNNVELAFNNLSTEDQDYLMEVYQDDLFMDSETY